jgi:hypothetical protein
MKQSGMVYTCKCCLVHLNGNLEEGTGYNSWEKIIFQLWNKQVAPVSFVSLPINHDHSFITREASVWQRYTQPEAPACSLEAIICLETARWYIPFCARYDPWLFGGATGDESLSWASIWCFFIFRRWGDVSGPGIFSHGPCSIRVLLPSNQDLAS